MASHVQRAYCWDVASALTELRDSYFGIFGEGVPHDPITVVDVDGYKTLQTGPTEWEGEYLFQAVVQTVAAGETIPARYLLSVPGFTQVRTVPFGEGFEPWYEWPGQVQTWKDFDVAATVVALEEFGNASVAAPSYHEISGAGGAAKSICAVLRITSDVECYAVTLTLNGAIDIDTLNHNYYPVTPPVVSGIGNAGNAGASAMARAAAALEEIANKRVEISANNGAALFSVTTGTRIEEEP